MTVASDDGAPRRFGKDWLGHYWIQAVVVWDVVLLPAVWLPRNGVTDAVNVAFSLISMWMIWRGMGHEVKLCEPCAAKTPLDGQAQAAKRRRALRSMHFVEEGRTIPGSRMTWRALALVAFVMGFPALLPQQPWWKFGGSTFDIVLFVVFMWVFRTHKILQPWCPQCRWGDGGEKELSPDPTPSKGLVPSGSAS